MASQTPTDPPSTGANLPTVRYSLPPVHPEGRKFAVIAGAVALFFFLIGWELLAWPMVGVTAWILSFFRDPVRTTPKGDDLIIAPADGMVTMIADVPPPPEIAGAGLLEEASYTRVSIFMSVFDVHINRAPISGTVVRVAYIAGKFLNADLDKASEDNERQHFLIEGSNGLRIGFTQIAGLVARRIVPWVKGGDTVIAGQRVGLIRFGSRVDVFLPAGTAPQVLLGQRTVAGETIIGRVGEAAKMEGISQ